MNLKELVLLICVLLLIFVMFSAIAIEHDETSKKRADTSDDLPGWVMLGNTGDVDINDNNRGSATTFGQFSPSPGVMCYTAGSYGGNIAISCFERNMQGCESAPAPDAEATCEEE